MEYEGINNLQTKNVSLRDLERGNFDCFYECNDDSFNMIPFFLENQLIRQHSSFKHVDWCRSRSMEAQAQIDHDCDWFASLAVWDSVL